MNATNSEGNGCLYYNQNYNSISDITLYDDDDFTASDMCCIYGGGCYNDEYALD